jgi:hypothetical protein
MEANRDRITKGVWKLGRDWELLALTDHYHTAVAIHDALQEGDVQDATQGLEELIDALSRSEERALESRLIRLMQQIIKWHVIARPPVGLWGGDEQRATASNSALAAAPSSLYRVAHSGHAVGTLPIGRGGGSAATVVRESGQRWRKIAIAIA